MRILIVYGTTEGHTRKVAEFLAEHLRSRGCGAMLCDAALGQPPDPAPFDAAILAASLHTGRYQPQVIHFAHRHSAALNAMPSAFISVSLSAAGEDPDDWRGLAECVDKLQAETGWRPREVRHVAGAIRFSAYDFFRKLAIAYIARRRGQKVKTSEDYDFTDYAALAKFADDFVALAEPAPAAASPASAA